MLRQHTTPAWIYFGGLVLATSAGVINAVGFLGQHNQALSHMTGIVTALGMGVGRVHVPAVLHALGILTAFFTGCLVSGAIVNRNTLRLGRRYGVALTVESAALFAAVWYLRRGADVGDYLAAMACGLQNAMASSYSGSTMRTTHMTGMVTDLGIACGHFLRGTTVDWYKFRLYGVLLLGFFLGGVLGALGYHRFGYDTLLFPAALSGATGLGYSAYQHRVRNRRGPAA